MKQLRQPRALMGACSLAVLLALAGCGERQDGQTVGQKVDAAIAKSGQAAEQVKQDAQEATADAKSAAQSAGDKAEAATAEARTSVMGAAGAAKDKAESATDRAGATIDDAQITANVKTGLSADKDLRATQIDVDTREGVVTLNGSAPTSQAKQRANEIARNVKDVKSVNNQLKVAG